MKISTGLIAGLIPILGAIAFAILFLTTFGGIAHQDFTHVSGAVKFFSFVFLAGAIFGGYKLTKELPGETVKWVVIAYGSLVIAISLVYGFAPTVIFD